MATGRHNGAMHRLAVCLLVILLLVAALGAVAAATSAPGEAAAVRTVGETTTTLPGEEPGGTSPWVLVLIGAAAGAAVGVFTGLARRRRSRTGR